VALLRPQITDRISFSTAVQHNSRPISGRSRRLGAASVKDLLGAGAGVYEDELVELGVTRASEWDGAAAEGDFQGVAARVVHANDATSGLIVGCSPWALRPGRWARSWSRSSPDSAPSWASGLQASRRSRVRAATGGGCGSERPSTSPRSASGAREDRCASRLARPALASGSRATGRPGRARCSARERPSGSPRRPRRSTRNGRRRLSACCRPPFQVRPFGPP
jgi:hypothetical protein